MPPVAGPLPPLPDDHTRTRLGWHAVAEQVLAAARYDATGRIGLDVVPGGFATPAFPGPDGMRVVRVEGTTLVVVDDELITSAAPLSTLANAAALVGREPQAPGVYPAATDRAPDEPLDVDPAAADALAAWFALGARTLDTVLGLVAASDEPTDVTLWPEHFDVAAALGAGRARANYGASLGDDGVPEPYLYVGSWQAPPPDPFWDAPSFPGAVLRHRDVAHLDDPDAAALAFFLRGRALLRS